MCVCVRERECVCIYSVQVFSSTHCAQSRPGTECILRTETRVRQQLSLTEHALEPSHTLKGKPIPTAVRDTAAPIGTCHLITGEYPVQVGACVVFGCALVEGVRKVLALPTCIRCHSNQVGTCSGLCSSCHGQNTSQDSHSCTSVCVCVCVCSEGSPHTIPGKEDTQCDQYKLQSRVQTALNNIQN